MSSSRVSSRSASSRSGGVDAASRAASSFSARVSSTDGVAISAGGSASSECPPRRARDARRCFASARSRRRFSAASWRAARAAARRSREDPSAWPLTLSGADGEVCASPVSCASMSAATWSGSGRGRSGARLDPESVMTPFHASSLMSGAQYAASAPPVTQCRASAREAQTPISTTDPRSGHIVSLTTFERRLPRAVLHEGRHAGRAVIGREQRRERGPLDLEPGLQVDLETAIDRVLR